MAPVVAMTFLKTDNRTQTLPLAETIQTGAHSYVLRSMDVMCVLITIFWLSRAWYYPSLRTDDIAPGLKEFSFIAYAAMVYANFRFVLSLRYSLFLRNKFFIIFLCIGCLNLLWTYSFNNTLGMVRTEIIFFITCLFIAIKFRTKEIISISVELFGLLMVLSVLASTISTIGVMQGFDAGRWRGVFGHKNSLGEYATFTTIALFGFWRFRMGFQRRHLIYSLSSVTCLVMAESSNALANCCVGLLFMEFVRTLAQVRLTPLLKMSFFVFVACILPAIAYFSLEYATELLGRDLTFTGRTDIWRWFIFFADQRPWTGWGWATIVANESMLGYIRQTLVLPSIQTPHSGYISILVELGYPALVTYVIWMLLTMTTFAWRALIELDNISAIALGLFGAFTLHNFFESTAASIPSIWIFTFIAVASSYTSRQRSEPIGPFPSCHG